eukprot:GHVU01023061.1.p3 GENE.GHVU01023061.1~~GHVU01023061.1.p3  ORF type:complete len:180 (+),score=21.29 GHVU01023061.1:1576-2115(+)
MSACLPNCTRLSACLPVCLSVCLCAGLPSLSASFPLSLFLYFLPSFPRSSSLAPPLASPLHRHQAGVPATMLEPPDRMGTRTMRRLLGHRRVPSHEARLPSASARPPAASQVASCTGSISSLVLISDDDGDDDDDDDDDNDDNNSAPYLGLLLLSSLGLVLCLFPTDHPLQIVESRFPL